MSDSRSGMANRETAYAKINLALHVRERRADGYHQIETLFAFLDCGDELSVAPGEGLSLAIGGPFGESLSPTDNLVLQAAHRLADASGLDRGARLQLDKRLPVASGIGGGSADAAATLRLLNRFWGLGYSPSALAEMARPLGADVPACVLSQSCRGTGIGQDLAPLAADALAGHHALLVNPLIPVSTAAIFAAWDGKDGGPLTDGPVLAAAARGRNDLQPPAMALVPQVAEVLRNLEQGHPAIARMSGSGATCFALFESRAAAEAAQRQCQQAMDGLWTMMGTIR